MGTHTFTVTADDSRGGTASKTFTLTVSSENTNSPPVFTSQPTLTAIAGGLYTYDATASDPDGDTLSYSLLSGPDGVVFNPVTGLLQWIPTADQTGDHDFTLDVSDGRGGVASQSFTTGVAPVNRGPSITSTAPSSVYLGETYTYPVTATDPDGHTLAFSIDDVTTTADTNGDFPDRFGHRTGDLDTHLPRA